MQAQANVKPLPSFLTFAKQRVDNVLNNQLKQYESVCSYLDDAMRYALFNGGKRVRSGLIYSLEQDFALPAVTLDHIAAAIECVHASSLVHDDLPALDNDAMRRGQPACHIAFNEAIAILAGDALLNLAQQILLGIPQQFTNAPKILALSQIMTQAIGSNGLIGGQAIEFANDKDKLSAETLVQLYHLKTGSLLGAGIEMSLALIEVDDSTQQLFKQLMKNLGLVFQLQDDILDCLSEQSFKQKPAVPTLVDIIGLAKTQEYKQKIYNEALENLAQLNSKGYQLTQLRTLVSFIIERDY